MKPGLTRAEIDALERAFNWLVESHPMIPRFPQFVSALRDKVFDQFSPYASDEVPQ